MKLKMTAAYRNALISENACVRNCKSMGKSHNLSNYLFDDGSSVHFEENGKFKAYPKFLKPIPLEKAS
jgi:hypothetical protein